MNDMNWFDMEAQGGFHEDDSLELFGITDSPQQAHAATVSPVDLVNDSPIMSAPPSAVFPNLPTPEFDYQDSPDHTSSGFHTTPMFDPLDSDINGVRMTSLFADEYPEEQFDPSQVGIVSNDSFGSLPELPEARGHQASPMVRQKSSPGRPPIVHDRKASLSAGITKANQKSRKELPDIVIESQDDKETAKRKKNTAAARKSRQRKQDTLSAMSAEIERLRNIVTALGADPDLEYE